MGVTAQAETSSDGTIRLMSFNADLSRKGPGLLPRDIMRGKDKQIAGVISRILKLKPDILAMQSVDYDYDNVAADLLKEVLQAAGHQMPHHLALAPNTGISTGFDLDRNGYLGDARDMQGYGKFTGQGGLLLLSRFPIAKEEVQDFTALIWKDLPGAQLPNEYFTADEEAVLRLHSVGAWDVLVQISDQTLHILMSHAGPPVFDGPEDRNGLRNADEIHFWTQYIQSVNTPFVLMAGLNNDPVDGEGLKPALHSLLKSPELIDLKPAHSAGTDTVDWEFDDLRVDYVLPSSDLKVLASGVDWPIGEGEGDGIPRHKPVWVDILWD